jgi:hypothetical protein
MTLYDVLVAMPQAMRDELVIGLRGLTRLLTDVERVRRGEQPHFAWK